MLSLFCKPHKPPKEELTAAQQRLSDAMRVKTDSTIKEKVILSREIEKIALQWAQFDTSLPLKNQLFNRRLDSAVMILSSRLFMVTDPQKIIGSLNQLIFDSWSISFDSDRNNLLSLFPQTVLSGQSGSCVGMSLIYLLIAEKMDWPIYGVLAPSHMFVRFDDGINRFKIPITALPNR